MHRVGTGGQRRRVVGVWEGLGGGAGERVGHGLSILLAAVQWKKPHEGNASIQLGTHTGMQWGRRGDNGKVVACYGKTTALHWSYAWCALRSGVARVRNKREWGRSFSRQDPGSFRPAASEVLLPRGLGACWGVG